MFKLDVKMLKPFPTLLSMFKRSTYIILMIQQNYLHLAKFLSTLVKLFFPDNN